MWMVSCWLADAETWFESGLQQRECETEAEALQVAAAKGDSIGGTWTKVDDFTLTNGKVNLMVADMVSAE